MINFIIQAIGVVLFATLLVMCVLLFLLIFLSLIELIKEVYPKKEKKKSVNLDWRDINIRIRNEPDDWERWRKSLENRLRKIKIKEK